VDSRRSVFCSGPLDRRAQAEFANALKTDTRMALSFPESCSAFHVWPVAKRWPVLLALLVAVGALAVGLACLPYGGRVTRENCEWVKVGMAEAEVRAILGKAWDDSLFDPERPSMVVELQGPIWKYSRQWVGDDCEIFATFDDNGRVMNRVLASARPPTPRCRIESGQRPGAARLCSGRPAV
jgi:hypothetical protein